jgi:sulfur carrier protein
MQVTINGEPRDVPGGTIREHLVHLGLTEGPVAVEVNRVIVPRAQHPEHVIREGDTVEIVHMVGGG